MRRSVYVVIAGCVLALSPIRSGAQSPPESNLQPPSSFDGIGDRAARSRALFGEAAKVITSPRCMNCHPAGDHPTQGDDMHSHMPPVTRGENGVGVAGKMCSACHTDR